MDSCYFMVITSLTRPDDPRPVVIGKANEYFDEEANQKVFLKYIPKDEQPRDWNGEYDTRYFRFRVKHEDQVEHKTEIELTSIMFNDNFYKPNTNFIRRWKRLSTN